MKDQKRERQLARRTRLVARVGVTGVLPEEEGNDGGDSELREERTIGVRATHERASE
jgi:hypothetical protein